MTGHTFDERFAQHLASFKASKYAKQHGVRLRSSLYKLYNPMTFEEAGKREKELARRLRNRGFAVWQK